MEQLLLSWELFQFTPLREGRRAVMPSITVAVYFNSRPSARGDVANLLDDYSID